MAFSDVLFEDTSLQVNSGTAISMQCVRVTFDMTASLQVDFRPGLGVQSATHDNLLSRGDFVGFDNPRIVFEGVIDLTAFNTTTGAAPANRINQAFLIQMVKSGNVFKVYDEYNDNTTTPIFRTCGLNGTFPSETVQVYWVMIEGVHMETNPADSVEGHIVHYTLTCRQVRSTS